MKKFFLSGAALVTLSLPCNAEALNPPVANSLQKTTVTREEVFGKPFATRQELNRAMQVADYGYMVASPLIYSKRSDLLKHYVFVNGSIKLLSKIPICKKHPVITATTVFVGFSVGKELIWDLAMKKGNCDITDVLLGNLPGAVANIRFADSKSAKAVIVPKTESK